MLFNCIICWLAGISTTGQPTLKQKVLTPTKLLVASQISKQLVQPIENTLFFAGEGLHQGPQIGTVEGALASGREVSHRLIGCFDSENIV
jgi:hypothetical protein